jgi:hypothetical protein
MEQNQQSTGGKTKIRRSEEKIRQRLAEQEQSGLTVKEYCEANGITEKSFYRWDKKYGNRAEKRRKKKPAVQGGFASIEVISSVVGSKPQLFAEIGNIKLYKEVLAEYLKTLLS